MFHSDLLLRCRISFSPPQQPPVAAVTVAGDFSGSSSPAENHIVRSARGRSTRRWQPRRQPESHAPSRASFLRQLAVHAPARVGACLLLRRRDSTHRVVRRRLGLLSLRRSNPSPPDPPFGHFCAAVTFPSSSVFNSREPGHLQSTPELSRDPDLVQPSTSATAFTFSRTITNTGPLVMYLTRPGKKLLEECSA